MMDRRAVMAAMGAAGLALPARAAETGVSGWREAVLITPDAAPWVETLTAVGGWEVAWKGRSDAGQSRLWGLPASARGREVLMRN